uniref:hypothetical protein n=1 Tax=Faecalibaculum rodentium TaxID=1702221 RepID=UPI0026EBB644
MNIAWNPHDKNLNLTQRAEISYRLAGSKTLVCAVASDLFALQAKQTGPDTPDIVYSTSVPVISGYGKSSSLWQ